MRLPNAIVRTTAILLVACAAARSGHASDHPVNTDKLCGPESVALSPTGEIYVSQAGPGEISRVSGQGKVIPVSNLKAEFGCEALPLGLAFDPEGNLYVAVQNIKGGCVVRFAKASSRFKFGKPEIWREQLGTVNDIVINPTTNELFVSDSGPIEAFGLLGGRVFAFPLSEKKPRAAGKDDILTHLWFANGLAIDERKQILYVSQTYHGPWGGRVSWLDLSDRQGKIGHHRVDGWPDGIEWLADKRCLAICLQKKGALAFFSPDTKTLGILSLPRGKAPAGIARQGRALIWTDYWEPDILKIAKAPLFHLDIYHHHIYRQNIPTILAR